MIRICSLRVAIETPQITSVTSCQPPLEIPMQLTKMMGWSMKLRIRISPDTWDRSIMNLRCFFLLKAEFDLVAG